MPGSEATAPTRRRTSVGGGRVLMWRGGSLWVSRGTGPAQRHSHHAIQITLAPASPVRLRGDGDADWRALHASIVMPGAGHQFDGDGHDVAMVFVEPETTAGRLLIARYRPAGLAEIADDAVLAHARQLLAGLERRDSDQAMIAVAHAVIAQLAGEVPAAEAVDPRMVRALAWIRDHLDTRITLARAAAVAHLSPGRFRHLFVAQTGISFRAYVLWARVSTAMVTAMAGQSLTAAAQGAGFADSAHFSRTCKRMFGIAPSMLERG
jgi:AraC family transcriptional regulator